MIAKCLAEIADYLGEGILTPAQATGLEAIYMQTVLARSWPPQTDETPSPDQEKDNIEFYADDAVVGAFQLRLVREDKIIVSATVFSGAQAFQVITGWEEHFTPEAFLVMRLWVTREIAQALHRQRNPATK